ncbi:hypothetical protein JF729_07210 [Mycobacterium intracellulare]|uniref:hypothetical protein n=1 Tax=Mycobacterium intracellulare TaxID=1767 RepID=UPI001CD91D2E|nr:hypothetical protein [Mycobacterium intracellulare]MCA2247585.1 hypothetical protein [Mycobacterium intracellulare]
MSTPTLHHLPCTEPIYQACLAATAHNYGATVDTPVVTGEGIAVALSSWPRQQEALRALRLLGYAVTAQPVAVLLVRGWDQDLLRARAASLEDAVEQLQRWLRVLAHETLEEFIAAPEHGTAEEDLAESRAVAHARARARAALDQRGHQRLAEISDVELAHAHAAARPLLVRVIAAQAAVDALIHAHLQTARSAIGLYREYRNLHGYSDVERSCAKTVLDIDRGVNAFCELAHYEADSRLSRICEREGRNDGKTDA